MSAFKKTMGLIWAVLKKQKSADVTYEKETHSQLVLRDPKLFLAFGLGAGLFPFAPGTWGTLFAIPLWLVFSKVSLFFYAVILVTAFVFGVQVCGYAENVLKQKDFSGIVWDEFVGFWVCMFSVPSSFFWIFLGFVFFRVFDIWKPWPIRWIEKKTSSGFGIMIDDVIAGFYALFFMCFLQYVFKGIT